MEKIRKGIILSAGLGSRVLPFSKAIQKNMLPINNTPAIEIVVDELLKIGVEKILIVVGHNKKTVVQHFRKNRKIEKLLKNNKEKLILAKQQNHKNIKFKTQRKLNGTGGALQVCQKFIKNEMFFLAFADDIFESNASKLLVEEFNRTNKQVMAYKKVEEHEISKYSSIEFYDGNQLFISKILEKPQFGEAQSLCAGLGRFLLFPSVFEKLRKIEPRQNGEMFLTDALAEVIKNEGLIGVEIPFEHYDLGSGIGFVKANVDACLNGENKKELLSFLKSKI